jgi:hypothetical protein
MYWKTAKPWCKASCYWSLQPLPAELAFSLGLQW